LFQANQSHAIQVFSSRYRRWFVLHLGCELGRALCLLGLRGSEIWTILWTMEDPPARLLFRGSLRRSGGGDAHSAWLVGLCCRCDVSCFCFRSTLHVLPQANCDLDQDNNTVLNLATQQRPSPCTLLVLPTPSLSQLQPVSRTVKETSEQTPTSPSSLLPVF
jgi:hypothetical protein